MLLLGMSRYLVNQITHTYKFDSLDDVADLRTSRMDIVCELSAKMWSYWHSAPKGPGVYEMLLDWIKSNPQRNQTSPQVSAIVNSARIIPRTFFRHFG